MLVDFAQPYEAKSTRTRGQAARAGESPLQTPRCGRVGTETGLPPYQRYSAADSINAPIVPSSIATMRASMRADIVASQPSTFVGPVSARSPDFATRTSA